MAVLNPQAAIYNEIKLAMEMSGSKVSIQSEPD
jgi:hypothetical protein